MSRRFVPVPVMAIPRVLLTDHPWADLSIERDALAQAGAELVVAPQGDEQTLCRYVPGVRAIMTCWAVVNSAVLAAARDCRHVARMGIGLDNIDVADATRRGMWVTNVADYCQQEVAEHTLASLFSLARHVAWYHYQTKQGSYERHEFPPLRRIAGQTLGLVGLGRIGRQVAALAGGIGLRVIAAEHGTCPAVKGVVWRPLEALLAECDYLSLHCPLTENTRHLIGAAQLARMKPSAFLINTARGGLVDHAALAAALADGGIAGAALDVQDHEPPDLKQPPYCDPRVVVTPHIAFWSQESLTELRHTAVQQVVEGIAGREPPGVVNRSG